MTNTVNGLNQVTATSGSSLSYDARGNVIAVPAAASATGTAATYDYYAGNGLVHGPGGSAFIPDPLGRLFVSYAPALGATYYLMDGQTIVAELDSGSNVTRRYVHGPGTDEPLVWYEGSGTTTRRYHHADERGSVIAVSDGSAALVGSAPNRYDEYGNAQGTLTGRFGYTGQLWLPEAGLYHYRARAYNPAMGRFMQTDPIGFGGGMNVYAYVGNNPVNFTDPTGLQCDGCEIPVTGNRDPRCDDEGAWWDADPRHRTFCNPGGWSQSVYDPGAGVAGGVDGVGVPPTIAQQRQVCRTNSYVRRALQDPDVLRQMRNAIHQATHFGTGLSRKFIETGFWVSADFWGGGFTPYNIFTDERSARLNMASRRPSEIYSWMAGMHIADIAIHVHSFQNGLSRDRGDIAFAHSNRVIVVAVDREGNTYCHDGR